MDDLNDKPEADNPFHAIQKISPNTPIAPAHGIAAIALGMALKYHDIATVQDGTLYQQYKLEGRNMRDLQIDYVFDTAIQIERHLIASEKRIADIIVSAINLAIEDVEEPPPGETADSASPAHPEE